MQYKPKYIKLFSLTFAILLAITPVIPVFHQNKLKADGPVPGNDCGDWRWPNNYFAGYECFIRGIYASHSGIDPNTGCSITNRIQYSSGPWWNFCDPAHASLTNQEVIVKVRFVNNQVFNIQEFVSYEIYNQAPNQPNLISPQSNWELGPRTNGTYSGITCNTSGTGLGCSAQFQSITEDPDDTPPLTNYYRIRSSLGGNLDTQTTGEGTHTFTRTLTDGIWRWTARSVDGYNIDSGFAPERINIKVDTTKPSDPQIVNMPEFTAGTQNTVNSNIVIDNLSSVQYYFEKSDDSNFTENVTNSGWISSNTFIFADLIDNQTYYYRVKARDSLWNETGFSSITSSTQDATLPEISNLNISEQRISPQNQDGTKDSSTITFNWSELNSLEGRIKIQNTEGNTINEYTETLTGTSGNINYVWDGKDNLNNFVSDGAYKIIIEVLDKAGNISVDDSNFIIIDNSPATLNINQINGLWLNTQTINISGQTEIDAVLEFINTTTNESANPVPDITTGLFGIESPITFNLNLGENTFNFKAIDSIGNINEFQRNYYREEIIPTITITNPNNSQLINNKKPLITLNLTDYGHNEYISGIDSSSTFISLTHETSDELILVNQGINVASSLGHIQESCSSSTGTYGNSGPINCTYSFVFDNDLQPDGKYTIKAQIKDRAGNESTIHTSTFELDTNTFNSISNPTEAQIFNYSQIELRGTAERYASLTIQNTNNTDNISFAINQPETLDRVTVENCRETESPQIDGIKEICDWRVENFQLEKSNSPGNVLNSIQFTLTDLAGNIDNKLVNVQVNIFAINLSISSDLQYFSPNGDGRQDGINFTHTADTNFVQNYEIKILNSNDVTIKQFQGEGNLPPNTIWNGKDQNNNFVSDGTYRYTLSITTTDGVFLETTTQEIIAVTTLNDQVIITYPGDNSFTTRGVVNVQGIAPIGTTVKICDDIIGIEGTCNNESQVQVNQNGFFSTIIPLFRLPDLNQTEHYLTAVAFDLYGNASLESNRVKITVTTQNPFENVTIIPAFTGVNNQTDYQRIVDKLDNNEQITQEDINNLRSVIFRSQVNQGTERVRFSFANHINKNEITDPTSFSNLGWIDNNNQTHLFENFIDGITGFSQCNQSQCSWDFYYPIPPIEGGLYEIQFEGKLGPTIQTLTSPLIIDGNIPAAPLILDIDKIINNKNYNTNLFQNKYYSNSENILIKGIADPNANIEVKDQFNNIICQTISSAIGLWTCETQFNYTSTAEFNLMVEATLGSNTSISLSLVSLIIDKEIPQFDSLTTPNQWKKSGDVVDISLSSNEFLSYAINIDLGESSLNCINNSIQREAITNFNINSSYLSANGSFVIPGTAVEGRYCTQIEIQDIAGNRNRQNLILFVDNTTPIKPIIDVTNWGNYNGINSKPGFISKGRLNPEYVHEENVINIEGIAEELSIIEVFINGIKVKEVNTLDRNNLSNCISSGLDKVIDGVKVKLGYICKFKFNFNFDSGEKGYVIQVRSKDLSGNYSLISEDEVIYYDKTPPFKPEIVNIKSSSYTTIPLFQNTNLTQNYNGITKDVQIALRSYAESLSDLEYWQYDRKGNQIIYTTLQNNGNQFIERSFNLGSLGDDRSGCVIVENGRRKGICEDGLYTFKLRSTDAPGNQSQTIQAIVERDTVAPLAPEVGEPYICGSNVCVKSNGEPGSRLIVNNVDYGELSLNQKEFIIFSNWKYSTRYEFEIWSRDLARNESGKVKKNFIQIGGVGSGSESNTLGLQNYINAEADIYIDENGNARITSFRHVHPPVLLSASTEYGSNNVTINGLSINSGFVYQVKGNITAKKHFRSDEDIMKICQVGYIMDADEGDCIKNLLSDGEHTARQELSSSCIWLYAFNFNLYMNCVKAKIQEQKYYTSSIQIEFPFKIDTSIVNFYKNDQLFSQMENRSPNGNWSELFEFANPSRQLQEGNIIKATTKLDGTMQFNYGNSNYAIRFGSNGWESGFSNELKIQSNSFKDLVIHPLSKDKACEGFIKTSPYGPRSYLFNGQLIKDNHNGVDLAKVIDSIKGQGCQINSSHEGTVIFRQTDIYGGGNTVTVQHSNHFSTLYMHGADKSFQVNLGDTIQKGTFLMTMGKSGQATGVHLHFMLKVNGKIVNPEDSQYFGDLGPNGEIYKNTKSY